MNRASNLSGGGRPAVDRRSDRRIDTTLRGGSVAEVEATCRRIAEYLISIARDQELEPALQAFVRTFDAKRAELDAAARARSERVTTSFKHHGSLDRDGAAVRERCDPYFWG